MMTNLLEKLDCGGDAGDSCDAWGNPFPIAAAAPTASPSADAASIAATIPTTSTPATVATTAAPSSGAVVQAPKFTPSAPVSRRDPIMKRIAASLNVSRLADACVVIRNDLRELYEQNRSRTHLQESIFVHRSLIRSESNLDVIAAAHEQLALLESPSAKETCIVVCNTLRSKCEPLCNAMIQLMDAALVEADLVAEEIKAAERELFENFGAEWRPTILTERAQGVKKQLQETRKAIRLPEPPNRWEPVPPNHTLYDHGLMLFTALSA
jgi:hypothetical protein